MVWGVVQISTSWYFVPGIEPGISRILQMTDFSSMMVASWLVLGVQQVG